MLTRCPSCATVFRVDTVQLRAREGRVRCGRCHAVFDALDAMVELPLAVAGAASPAAGSGPEAAPTGATMVPDPSPPAEPPAQAADATDTPARLDLLSAPVVQAHDDSDAALRADAPEPVPSARRDEAKERPVERTTLRREARLAEDTVADDSGRPDDGPPAAAGVASGTAREDDPTHDAPAPDSAHSESTEAPGSGPGPGTRDPLLDRPPHLEPVSDPAVQRIREELYGADAPARRSLWSVLAWGAGAMLGLLLMLGQLTYLWRSELALAQPALQPLLERACATLGCSLAPPRRIDLLSIESSELNPLPDEPPLLQLRALLRNDADFAQDWPHLELTLTDAQDRAVVRRVLTPADYLPADRRNEKFTGHSERSVSVRVDPTDTAAGGYRLYVFYP